MRENQNVGARGPRVVALGGGHGLYASLSALRILTPHITAVVTVADDGGSSGRIRQEMDVLPPGDLRMALAALCDDSDWGQTWRDVLQHRFESTGPLNGHAVGNLLIVATWRLLHDELDGLDLVGRLLGIRGRVVPMSTIPLQIEADVCDVSGQTTSICGQVAVATSHACVERVGLIPANPPAHPAAVDAIDDADWVIIGPGSWYTSIIPHLLVPDLLHALENTRAKKALVMNLVPDEETAHLSPSELIMAFRQHAPDITIDCVIVDPDTVGDRVTLENAAKSIGANVMVSHVAKKSNRSMHDPLFLATAFRDVIDSFS
ncbi:gluconeogenesis factor YvcK family protein [Arcanobacterium buesumense]|uniref:Putative gluconeogenesis factor n=1 Tax=Arcanobacterium buesumense TaxID=2722751 RepID=A0A6H2EL71_9ACTO|nr:uridine diphosphate-N-acetylglucosamine-binding protein YvcK [Arcanobacterium buesumense]QJC21789.1 uridine diphosphate-N-acetylglucosamine-binding protein YvcK [Arcanobacterium buesumense]